MEHGRLGRKKVNNQIVPRTEGRGLRSFACTGSLILWWLATVAVFSTLTSCSDIPPNLPTPKPILFSSIYGITWDTTWSRRVAEPERGVPYYLIKFSDMSDLERYAVIDSFWSESCVFTCDTNAVAYFQINQDSHYLIEHYLSPDIGLDTILTIDIDTEQSMLNPITFIFRSKDSLLVYTERPFFTPSLTYVTIVAFVRSTGGMDTVA